MLNYNINFSKYQHQADTLQLKYRQSILAPHCCLGLSRSPDYHTGTGLN